MKWAIFVVLQDRSHTPRGMAATNYKSNFRFLLAVNTSGVLDDQTQEDALVDVFHLRNLRDATVLGSLLDVVLLTLRAPRAQNVSRLSLTHLRTYGTLLGDSGTAVDCCAAAK